MAVARRTSFSTPLDAFNYRSQPEHSAQSQLLKVAIDGCWTTGDFVKLFAEVELLRDMALFGETKVADQTPTPFRYMRDRPIHYHPLWTYDYELEAEVESGMNEVAIKSYVRSIAGASPELQIKQMHFAEPGFIEFAGLGRNVANLRSFILGIIDRWLPTEGKLPQHGRQAVLAQKIANAERFLRLADKPEIDQVTKRQLVRRVLDIDNYFESSMLDGKIVDITEVLG